MTFAAEEEERVWEEEGEKERWGICLGLVDWTHHGGAKKKKGMFCLAERKAYRKRWKKSGKVLDRD